MRLKPILRRGLALVCCLLLLSCPLAQAREYVDVTWVTNSGNDIIDTLYGVDAHFSSWNCWAYVLRFYEEGFGIRLQANRGMPTFLSGGAGKWFVQLSDDQAPRPGDILYGSAAMRGSGDHYALVKSYDPETGVMTLIEENFKWNGQSAKDRKVPWPTPHYNCYRLMDENGPVVPGNDTSAPPSEPALPTDPSYEPSGDQPGLVDLSETVCSNWARENIIRAVLLGICDQLPDYTLRTSREAFCGMALHTIDALGVTPEILRLCPPEQDVGYAARAYEIGLIDGNSVGDLTPEAYLTRQQASKILERVFRIVGELPEVEPEILKVYRDAEKIAGWAQPYVASMTACGVIQGMGEADALRFEPDESLTLEMALTLLLRVYDNPSPVVSVFLPTE